MMHCLVLEKNQHAFNELISQNNMLAAVKIKST